MHYSLFVLPLPLLPLLLPLHGRPMCRRVQKMFFRSNKKERKKERKTDDHIYTKGGILCASLTFHSLTHVLYSELKSSLTLFLHVS